MRVLSLLALAPIMVFAQTPSPVLNPVYVGTSVNQQLLGINTPQPLSYAYFVAWDAQKPRSLQAKPATGAPHKTHSLSSAGL